MGAGDEGSVSVGAVGAFNADAVTAGVVAVDAIGMDFVTVGDVALRAAPFCDAMCLSCDGCCGCCSLDVLLLWVI